MTMSQDWGERAGVGGPDGSATGVTAERYYMNKAYGRSLERARALDAQAEGQRGVEFQRATIEPEAGGGHKVIVEHRATVIDGGRDGEDVGRSEHSFVTPEDAIQFLRDILRGHLQGEGGAGRHSDAGLDSELEGGGNEGPIQDGLGERG
jgi:hypothetical protein